MLPAKLLKRYRMIVHVEEPDLTAEQTVNLFDGQNADVGVVRRSKSRNAKSAYFAALTSATFTWNLYITAASSLSASWVDQP